jgi:microcystin degradation protein MlrC
LHANISAELAAASDMLIGYETYPHVDMEERGVEAAQLMVRIVRDGLRVHQVFRQLPLITLPPKQCTLRSPMRELIGSLRKLKSRPEILSATVAMGFPFADIPNTGVSLVVSADEAATAEAAAAELSDLVWGLRDELQPELVTIETAMQRAGANAPDAGPLIFADGSDNPGGGAPCDGTVALHALVDAGFAGAVVGVLHDPETVAQAHDAGVGATIEARIGGKSDNLHGATLVAPAYVRALNDGQFTHRGPMFHNLAGDMGRMATVVVNQVLIVVAENRRQLLDSEMLRIAGVTPEHARLIVVKSAVHFRGDFERFASEIVDADTPGIHRPDFGCFRFSKLRRPIYPLDELDEL